jgi:hypothetical protein
MLLTANRKGRWHIVCITSTRAQLIGHVYAPDEDASIKQAIAQFDVHRPWRNRLLAIRESLLTRHRASSACEAAKAHIHQRINCLPLRCYG